MRQRQIRREILIRVDFVIHRTDKPCLTHCLTLLVKPAYQRGIQPVLGIQRRRKIGIDRANDGHASVQIGLLVEDIQLPVNKRPQEVTFTKLDHARWVAGPRKITSIQCLHRISPLRT